MLLLLLHTRALYPELIDKIADKITEVRFQKVFKDLDTLNIEKNKIELNYQYIEIVKRKFMHTKN